MVIKFTSLDNFLADFNYLIEILISIKQKKMSINNIYYILYILLVLL